MDCLQAISYKLRIVFFYEKLLVINLMYLTYICRNLGNSLPWISHPVVLLHTESKFICRDNCSRDGDDRV